MKLQYEDNFGYKYTIECEKDVTLTELLQLTEQLYRGAGFYVKGTLDIIDDE